MYKVDPSTCYNLKDSSILNLTSDTCKHCSKPIISFLCDWLQCIECSSRIHLSCLHRGSTPGGLQGDVFFDLTCAQCSSNGQEVLDRDKMPWFTVCALVMHQLHTSKQGTANNGYFHWRIHLIQFIEKNWDVLFHKNFKKRKNWTGTIAGILSSQSPLFFQSGARVIRESGWWRLTFPELSPGVIVVINNELVKEKQKKTVINESEFVENKLKLYLSTSKEIYKELVLPSHTGQQRKCEKYINFQKSFEKDNENTKRVAVDFKNIGLNISEIIDQMDIGRAFFNNTPMGVENIKNVNLLSNSRNSDFFSLWQKQKKNKSKIKKKCIALNIEEERLLYNYISKNSSSTYCYRLLRKLQVREAQRSVYLNFFNPDTKSNKSRPHKPALLGTGIKATSQQPLRLVSEDCGMSSERISPYTSRLLKPYIRRDDVVVPSWLRLMLELRHCLDEEPVTRGTLDFCYVAPNHIPAVNSLCEYFFWPGIDLSETLQYPDFTCVVLYKKLIVGFAFMVPDTKHNEAYISFIFTLPSWRGCGIATFMIYHLIQTCLGKDITLHVAIDNPAIFLYQKFGFKVEEVVYNFYDNYMHHDDKKSRHAFFLRLER